MKLAYATILNARHVENWSGTPYYMTQALEAHSSLELFGDFEKKFLLSFKIKRLWKKLTSNERESDRYNILIAKNYSEQLAKRLANKKFAALLAPQINPICYLAKQPTVLWTDAVYSNLLNYYPGFTRHSKETMRQGHEITQQCLNNCKLAIFSSEWAAAAARDFYQTPAAKVKVVPFGANIVCNHTEADIKSFLRLRNPRLIKFLFIGKHWERKGGRIVFEVAKALHAANIPVEVNLVGCHPPKEFHIPPYIKCHGFISKKTPAGVSALQQMLRETHFLFVPSRAEAYGIVFCEANAYGVPCLTTATGGIPSIVKEDINGKCFDMNAPTTDYLEFILKYIQNYSQYEALALSAFQEYATRLNWQNATQTVIQMIREF
jgi:glycosyltransferase involved in cell wall biosynthesis